MTEKMTIKDSDTITPSLDNHLVKINFPSSH